MIASIQPERVLADLKELRQLTSDANGAQRVAWTPIWKQARDWFTTRLAGLPFSVEDHLDAAGNRWVTLQGASERALLLGSHLDSVPNGGWLDGALGVLAALEVMRAFGAQGQPPVTVRLVDFADEEGARFGRSVLGSSAFAGTHTIEADRAKTDRDGIRLDAALAACGVDIDRFPEAKSERVHAAAYLELHIEQGPVLESMGLPLGVVLGTKGVERHAVTFHGQEAHSGSTPMEARRDALAPAAKLALAIREIARRHPGAVCTMGSVRTLPGIATAVVGRCETMLDQRDLDAGLLAGMLADARNAAARFAAEEGCTVEWSRVFSTAPAPFHPELMDLCETAVLETAGASHRLPSGPLHDACEVARCGIPAAMMFVQSLGGISHNKVEDTAEEHLRLAIVAYARWAELAAEWILRDKQARPN